MSKSLEKLALIQKVFEKLAEWNAYDLARLDKDYETNFDLDFIEIEKELKDYEYWTSFVKCYGDVKAEDLQRFIHNGWVYDIKGYKKDEALEIIKEKRVDVDLFLRTAKFSNVELYNFEIGNGTRTLTQEEFDSLKEVLL